MTTWGANWQAEALDAAKIPVSAVALRALTAWAESTPTESWTNNPLGLPSNGKRNPPAPGMKYAIFVSSKEFRYAFRTMMSTAKYAAIGDALAEGDSFGKIWRAVNLAKLPCSDHESDYPVRLLDLVEESYTSQLAGMVSGDGRSSGAVNGRGGSPAAMRQVGRSVGQASASLAAGARAMGHITRRM